VSWAASRPIEPGSVPIDPSTSTTSAWPTRVSAVNAMTARTARGRPVPAEASPVSPSGPGALVPAEGGRRDRWDHRRPPRLDPPHGQTVPMLHQNVILRRSMVDSVTLCFLSVPGTADNGRRRSCGEVDRALGCRICTNRRNRTSQPRRRCGGCSTSWRRSSRPGCAGRPSRSPWPRSAPRSVPPCCGSSSPAGSAPKRRCSPAPVPSAAAWSPAIRSSLSCGRPTAPSI
jgi:hypothetical protein